MNFSTYLQYLLEAVVAVEEKSGSFRLGNGTVTVSATGTTPAHLTFAQIGEAVAMALAGAPASIASGDVTISYTPNSIPTVAPPAPAA